LTGVVAMNDAGCIGRDGAIPWHHREDLRFFKRMTTGGTVVLGRKTWDGLPRRPLPRRDHVVLTSDPERAVLDWDGRDLGAAERPSSRGTRGAPVVRFCALDGLEGALIGLRRPVFVIGGAAVYDALWDRIDRFLVTRVAEVVPGCDTFLPRALEPGFALVGTQALSTACTLCVYRRVAAG
jgi:dihydrofolate reductase